MKRVLSIIAITIISFQSAYADDATKFANGMTKGCMKSGINWNETNTKY